MESANERRTAMTDSKTGIEKEQKARKKPMTTAELFQKICATLKEKGMMPDILDYGLPTNSPVPIKTYEFDLRNNLGYGGSEGIYLDFWIEYFEENEKICKKIGTFKTLNQSREAMHTMAGLLADFIVAEYDYVNKHLDDFNWTGVDVHVVKDGKKLSWYYSCCSMEDAMKRKDELLQEYPGVIIRNNATRKETEFKNA